MSVLAKFVEIRHDLHKRHVEGNAALLADVSNEKQKFLVTKEKKKFNTGVILLSMCSVCHAHFFRDKRGSFQMPQPQA